MPLAESKQTCQSTCSPPHGSRSAGMVGVVLGYDRVATAAAGFKGKVPFDIDFYVLTIQRVAAELFAKAASELGIMVCRRVRRPSASPHRHRDRTRLWYKWDCMAKRMRATGKPRVSNMGTFWAKPRTH